MDRKVLWESRKLAGAAEVLLRVALIEQFFLQVVARRGAVIWLLSSLPTALASPSCSVQLADILQPLSVATGLVTPTKPPVIPKPRAALNIFQGVSLLS